MPYIREYKLFMKVVHVLNLYHKEIISTHVLKGAEALALIADTDDFKTKRYEDIILDIKDAEALVNLKVNCLSAFQGNFEQRKMIRPLVEAIDQAKRRFRL